LATAGKYELIISTETTDFSGTTPHAIAPDASGSAVQLGTIETPGEVDLFSFTAPVTGQVTVRVDGGVTGQLTHLLTTAGQTFGVQVFDANNGTGLYVLTITSIADDFPDNQVFPVTLNADGSGSQSGTINYSGDVDAFRFTAPVSGTMTLSMTQKPNTANVYMLQSSLSVSGANIDYDITPSVRSPHGVPANNEILQFQVVQGQQYTVRAAGANGSSGDYILSFSMAVDSDSTAPQVINMDALGDGSQLGSTVSQSGSIVVPGDQELYQFTAPFNGAIFIAMNSVPGTDLQGLLSFPSKQTVLVQAFANIGWLEATRNDYLAIQVAQGQTYQFLVSGDNQSIGSYNLTLSVGTSGVFIQTFSEAHRLTPSGPIVPNDSLGYGNEQFLSLNLANGMVFRTTRSTSPQTETSQVTSTSTNTRLAVFSLSTSSGGSSTGSTTAVSVPSGQSTQAPNSLIATLLTVAARDSSLGSTDPTVASSAGSANTTAATTALLIALVTPGSGGGGDMGNVSGAASIGGSVFQDLDGNGRGDAGKTGVAGDTIILEMKKGTDYVQVAKVTTDDKGAFSFAGIAPGEYRVSRVGAGGNLTSYSVTVTSDDKVKIVNFGKGIKRGQSRVHLSALQESVLPETVGRAFEAWYEDNSGRAVLDEHDAAVHGWLLCPLALLPAAALGLMSYGPGPTAPPMDAIGPRRRRMGEDGSSF
jgi:hypothetical protein